MLELSVFHYLSHNTFHTVKTSMAPCQQTSCTVNETFWRTTCLLAVAGNGNPLWTSSCCRNFPVFSTPGPRRKPGRVSRMFSTSVKSSPHPKIPRPERLDEIYVALKKGIQSVPAHGSIATFPCPLTCNVLLGHTCVFSLQGLPAGLSAGFGQLQQTDERIQEELQTGTFALSRYLQEGQMYFSLLWPWTDLVRSSSEVQLTARQTPFTQNMNQEVALKLLLIRHWDETQGNRHRVKLKMIITTQYTLSIWNECCNFIVDAEMN